MRLGLISDTHVPGTVPHPPLEVERAFADVDMILHAGDIYTSDCLDWLEQIAPVVAVEVFPAPVQGDPRVERKRVVEVGGYKIGLVHDLVLKGFGFEVVPGVIERQVREGQSISEMLESFFGEDVHAVVFGDTHIPVNETHQEILFVNPGSPVLPHQRRQLGTVGIMELGDDGKSASIVDLTDFSHLLEGVEGNLTTW